MHYVRSTYLTGAINLAGTADSPSSVSHRHDTRRPEWDPGEAGYIPISAAGVVVLLQPPVAGSDRSRTEMKPASRL